MVTITLYTKEGCHLCEDVKAMLAGLRTRYPHELVEVDITENEALFERYRFSIPVVSVGQAELRAPITEAHLIKVLQ